MLVDEAERRGRALEPRAGELERLAADAPLVPSFARALRRASVGVIAEIKRRSPSKGDIAPGLSAADQARAYAAGGAAALSVLTEPTRFGGSEADLRDARDAVSVPLLKKDFHVAPAQVIEARVLGASALLLIARALRPTQLRALAALAADVGLDVLVEVRDERELETALSTEAAVIGVNNRNLETLAIDLATGERLVPLIPPDRVAVFESGVSTSAEVERAAAAGADAVLVGSSVSASADPTAAVRALASVARVGRRASVAA
ncbi:Indole-3-glycerol phosphate synthase [Gemmatirosa kalamazoonensis]|uniref:indole-3-glycerol-phosphate synthase n=1 Tax=Gemmatirosa kalamazoonensis TaxID=861299 RepID=W0RKD4_9BACT|nr:indole-3-glycerol phosphate synthase TrpC [Gemmatirosa kalamazoonensis]AHG90902.1 Indole-3-glycerol phosphate synthase [Gemmatirosa kalamazoonensis]